MDKFKSAILAIALSGCFAPPPIGGEGELIDNDGDGFTADADCNDTNAAINPGAPELCDGADNDCDGQADEGCETPIDTDLDNDGHHVPADCNDGNPSVHPGATEICDGLDNNCSGGSDEGLTLAFYRDADGDGYGRDVATPIMACTAPTGYVPNNGDCDDSQALRAPNKPELCDNGIDNDCDGLVDSEDPSVSGGECADAVGEEDCFRDIDGDGFGRTPSVSYQTCPDGWVEQNHDCDDTAGVGASRYPGADENCQNSVDDDCDGTVNDGCPTGPVCTPTGAEICGDGRDNDCNAATTDVCPVCVPTGAEICGNSIDEDCVGGANACPTQTHSCWTDADDDGYGVGTPAQRTDCLETETDLQGGDCNDGDRFVNPGRLEVHDVVDNDCDGAIDELGLVTLVRWHRTSGTTDWDHRFASASPGAAYATDGKWISVYPTNVCSGTYRPYDNCTVTGNGSVVQLAGGKALVAISECRGNLPGGDASLYLTETSGEYADYSVRSGFTCSRLGYVLDLSGTAVQILGSKAVVFWRHSSPPFTSAGVPNRPGVADVMWSSVPTEGQELADDIDYDEHRQAFAVIRGY